MNINEISTEELEKELKTRQDRNLGRCEICGGKWPIYMGCSGSWQEKPHCFGCRKPVNNCICSR